MGIVFVSEDAYDPLTDNLRLAGHDIFRVNASHAVYGAVASHPDIFMCRVKDTLVIDDSVVTTPSVRKIYEDALEEKNGNLSVNPVIPAASGAFSGGIVFDMGHIGYDYPDNVPYNAVSTDKYFIHNTELTSPLLLDRVRDAGLDIINVKQGYTKCSCVAVGDRAIITADPGIVRTIRAYNEMLEEDDPENAKFETIACLQIRKGYVELPGHEYGFLGGASGQVEDKIYFNGDLSEHPDFDIIYTFIQDRGLEPVWYEGLPLRDIGSVIYLR